MTKKEIAVLVESLVEGVAVNNGATMGEKTIKVGGRETQSRVATDGLFDLDACRGVLAHRLRGLREVLTAPIANQNPNDASDLPRVGPAGVVGMKQAS